MGLRSEEVEGQPLGSLDVGFPVDELKQPLRRMFAQDGEVEVTVQARTRRGKRVDCRVRMQPLRQSDGETYGALFLMEVSEAPEE